MKSQATKLSPKQQAYLSYWEKRGYRFQQGDKIPESTSTPPGRDWHPGEFIVSGVLLIGAVAWMWFRQ